VKSKRAREREREKDRHTDRQTDRQREGEGERKRGSYHPSGKAYFLLVCTILMQ
jgi:hypothetical protein